MSQEELVGVQQRVLQVMKAGVAIGDLSQVSADEVSLGGRGAATERQQVDLFENFIVGFALCQ